jgi:hypothetical protein
VLCCLDVGERERERMGLFVLSVWYNEKEFERE